MKTAGVEGLGGEGVGGDIQRVGRQTRESGPQ
jgi:hypothetical protein